MNALERFEAVVEGLTPWDDLDRVNWGGVIVDTLIAVVSGGLVLGLGDARVCVRIRDRSDGKTVYVLECGRNASLAERVAQSFRAEMESLAPERFLEEYRIHPERVWGSFQRAYLGIGSNVGDRLAHLQAAVDGLHQADGVTVVRVSHVYETEPVGGPEQAEYLNAVVAVDTTLHARDLLVLAKRLEQQEDRQPGERWGPRTLDVDVLIVGEEEVHDPDLEVPHPRLHDRGFVLAPLGDFLPSGIIDEPDGGWPGVRLTDLSLKVP